jgi:site-specific DNA recombinase
MTQNLVAENARKAQNQDDYNKKYNSLVERYEKQKAEYDDTGIAISEKDAKYEQMGRFITVLKGQTELVTEFDESLWSSLAEKIVIKSKEEVTVVFKDGTEITIA